MPTATGRAFTTANFLPNLAALKAINFGASDPLGCWFVVPNSTTNNIEIWIWEPTSTATTNEVDVVRPDSIAAGSPGRCIQRLKFDASQLAGFLGALAGLSNTGLVERTSGGGAIANAISAFGKILLNLADAAAGRAALLLGNVSTRSIGTVSGNVRDAADTAYTNARNPTAHASTHAAGGADEVQIFGYLAVSANSTLNATHERLLIDVNATSAALTITLPAAATVGAGWQVQIRKSDISGNLVTIARSGSDTINGLTALSLNAQFQTFVLQSFGGTSWGIVGIFDNFLRTADNLANLGNRQAALNNLAGAVTANRFLRANGTNVLLDQVNLATDVSGVLPIANGSNFYSRREYNTLGDPNIYSFGVQGAEVNLGEGLAGWHFFSNLRANDSFGVQFAISDTSNGLAKFRSKSNNAWQSWHSLAVRTVDQSFTSTTQSTSTTTGAIVLAGGLGVAGNQYIGGFTSLGDNNTGLKCKPLTGNTATTQGASVAVAHGLNGSKITSITGVIYYTTNGTVPIGSLQANYQTVCASDHTNISITNVSGNSAGILNVPFTLLVWYRP